MILVVVFFFFSLFVFKRIWRVHPWAGTTIVKLIVLGSLLLMDAL